MTRHDVEAIYPLAAAQEGILFDCLVAPDSGVYVAHLSCLFEGQLDIEAFRQAWQVLTARHAALRTVFLWQDLERPLQVVRQNAEVPLTVDDWRPLSPLEQAARLADWLRRDRATPYDLGRGPLHRLALLRCTDEAYRFVWSRHHLILDGWSLGRLLGELFEVYEAARAGRQATLPKAMSHRAYLRWLERQDLAASESYWRRALAGFSHPTSWGASGPTTHGANGSPSRHRSLRDTAHPAGRGEKTLRLSAADSRRLEDTARRLRVTPNTLVQGAWAICASRFSGASEVVFGVVVAGRPPELAGAESMVGMFINTLPLRARVDPAADLGAWLEGLRRAGSELETWSFVPLNRVREWSDVAGGAPLFDSLVAYESYPLDQALLQGAAGLRVSEVQAREQTAAGLALQVTPGENFRLGIEFDNRRFAPTTVQRWLRQMATLLHEMGADSRRRLGALPLESPAERHQMLIEWNSPRPIEETDDPSSDLLLQRFVRQVASRGEAVAVVLDHESATQVLSYGALAAASRRLASSLRSLGVAPEERVALASERCGEMVIGLLAILQAGATFLPIDPKTPAERLRFMLADSKARVLLTLERHLENLGVGSRTSVVCLDGVRPSSVSPSSVSPSSVSPSGGLPGGASPADPRLHNELPALPTADRAAYVIYTSGSTGRPKGVEVSHGALSHVLAYRAATTATTDAKLQRTTLSFDVAIAEIFLPLVTGGRTVLAPPGAETDGDALARLIRRQRITLAAFPPSLLAPLTRGGRIAECPSLRTVGVGGEAVPVDLPARFYAQSEAELINRYGPTEAAIFMLDWRCRRETEPSLPIGRPVGANRVALVDPDLRPTPLEAAGELAIAGPSLARGYLDRPAMTAAAFIPDPTPQGSGGRLYKTGDLARFRVDGALEFLGRIDQQIKIRGFRVELGEIEAVLAEHPAVDESAVIARHDGPSQRLVAYVAARSTGEEEAEEEVTAALQGHLHARVPDYMIPPVFVFLQALPRNASGKLDRQALPAPARRSAAHQSTAPRNATEAALADIWRQVLRLEALGVEDNFFALGGDSILCLQVVNRARQAGFELTPRQVFDHPTLAELAAVTQQASAEPEPQPAAEPLGTVPLTPIQRWFFDQDFAEPWHWNQSLLLRPRRRLDRARIDQALDRLVHRHDALRLRFEPSDEGWRQHRIAARDATLSSCEIDFTALAEVDRTVAATAAANALQASLDLTAGPIGRIALLRQEADDDRLFWLLHHLVVDAVSWRVLLADFEDAYRRPESATPSPRSTPFAGWAAGLADLTTAPELAAELDFWQSQPFARVEPLAIDEPAVPERSDTLEADAATVTTWLDAGHLEALLRQAPGTYRLRVEELLLIALVATLADHSSTRTVALELEGHGRDLASLAPDLDLSATVGWFTTLYPVVLRVPQACGEPETSERGVPPRRLIREVKEQLRRIPSHGIGFGLLASTAETGAALRDLPIPEVLFNHLGQLDAALDPHGLLAPAPETLEAEHQEGSNAFGSLGNEHSPRARRRHRLEVTTAILGGRLRLAIRYGTRQNRRATLQALADQVLAELRRLIDHCLSPTAGGLTPSDVPDAALDQAGLDRLVERWGDPRQLEALYPLTPMQEGMLFHSLYAPESGVFVGCLTCRLIGDLDEGAFADAWRDLLRRHAVLRTAFLWEDLEQPLQGVAERVDLPLDTADWRALSSTEQQPQWQALLARQRRLALDQAPLLRLALARTAERGWRFAWTFHHLLLDGWSLAALLEELFELYAAKTSAAGERQRRPPRPYRDYVRWLGEQDAEATEGFWRQQLVGSSAPTPLGIDRGAAGTPGDARQQIERDLSGELTGRLANLAKTEKLTLATLVQGAYATLLGRYASTADVVFGAVVAGRPARFAGVERMIGLFINTLPVRVRIDPEAALADWLRGLRDRQMELSEHESTPLVRIQGWSGIAGGALFDSVVAFENYPLDDALRRLDGPLRVADVATAEHSNYPLNLMVVPLHTVEATTSAPADEAGTRLERLRFRALYDAERFDSSAIDRLLGHLRHLLGSMSEDPSQRLDQLRLLSAAERAQLLQGWNDTARPFAEDGLLHHLFARRATAAPDALAVIGDGGHLSYGELARRAHRLAHGLRQMGVGQGTPVGLYLRRTVDMVVAVLAVLSAGGAYVPLAASFPRSRIGWILRRLEARALLTDAERLADLGQLPAELPDLEHVVCLGPIAPSSGDEIAGDVERWHTRDFDYLSTEAPATAVRADDAAYVIFTSGSTGAPKGVVVRHRPVINLIEWIDRRFAIGPDDRVLAVAALSFDLSVYDLFGLLAAGGQIRLASDDEVADPEALVRILRQERITFWDSAPAALQQLVPLLQTSKTAGDLRLVFLSGDWIPLTLPDAVRRTFPHARVIGLGGATEATVWSNVFPVGAVDPAWASIPYGRPIANARYLVLDERLEPCPIGIAGDLFIGGRCLASGYAVAPALTADRFLPDPWSERRGGRLYRTGDRARFGPDGLLEFLGRLDHQVKIRGFRIELGEVESVLAEHPGVAEAIVVVRAAAAGGAAAAGSASRSLAAFVLTDPALEANPPDADDLRQWVAERLPDYMLPAALEVLDELPMTANGKVDRAALVQRPLPAAPTAVNDAGHAPRNPREATLITIWREVLRRDEIGIHDNFFELGGDSILSIQVVSRARQAGLEVTPRQVFSHPTVAALAAASAKAASETGQGTATDSGPVVGAVALSPIQHWFFEHQLAEPWHWNQSLLLAAQQPLDPPRVERTVAALVQHHDLLRARFTPHGGQWRQHVVEPTGEAPCTTLDLSALATADQPDARQAAYASLQASLDLSGGPLLRVALFRSAPQRSAGESHDRLLWIVHHLVVDAVSWLILLGDFERTYRQSERLGVADLPPRTTSYAAWSEDLQAQAEALAPEALVKTWLTSAWGQVPALPLADGEDTEGAAQGLVEWLPRQKTHALLHEVANAHRADVDELLLAALLPAWSELTGSPFLALDLEAHGRQMVDALDVSRTVGWFTALQPVLLETPESNGRASSTRWVRAVRAKLAAQPEDRQTYGLLRYLKDAPAAGALAARRKPEILFNYLGQLDVALPPDALLTPIDEPSGPPRAPGAQRRHPIELNASVIGGRLRLECRFPSRRLSPDLAKTLSRGWLDHLSTLVDDATRSVKRGVAPADAPADFGLSPSERGGIDPIEAVYPLSPTQEGMLFHSLYAPESGVYVGQVSLRIDGRFDTRAFLAAWERLLDRHAALRTAFIWADREAPLQQVRARAELTIERRDWRGRTTPHRDEAWRDLLATDRQRGYDLAEAPLIRLFLIRQSETSWRFLWSYHHIILDGWSLAILFEELFALYRDADASDLPARRPYGDYLHHLARRDTDAEQRYWQRRLEGLGAPTPLGLERSAARRTAPSEAEEKPARGRVVRVLGPRRTRRLQGLARRAEIPLNTLVQGAWALLLARYADQSEVVFGTVLAGRSPLLRGAESMVGLFINTLPVRCDVAPEAPAAAWLRQLRDDLLELRDFEATPLVRVQGWANAWNDLPAGQALFDSLVAFENYPIDEALRQQADGLEIHQVEAFERSNYPLGLQAVPEGRTTSAEARPASGEVGRLVLQLHFDRQRFATTAVGRLGEQLETAIHALAEAGDRRLGELPWLSPAERHQTLVEWNYPFHGFTRQSLMGHGTTEHDLLPQLFATSVSRRGDAVAVRADQVLTYAELDARSRRLAARLVALGAGPETVIGLCLERSPEMIVALLAIVRSGSVFLPLDPSYPKERLAYMLADAAAPLLITRSGLRAQLPALREQLAGLRENLAGQHEQSAGQHEQSVGPRKILCIDEPGLFDAPDDAASDALSTLPTCAPHHAAYLIYTSGSTGRPKGVVISHGALANLLRYRRLGLGPEQVQLQRTSLSFDIGLAESFLPLVFGSCLVLAPASRELGNTELARLIGRHRITLASFTPSLLETFLESQALTDCPSLRLVSCGAETMPADLPNRFFAQSRAELRNRYGPTEATIYMAEWRCSPDERSPVPIGRPAAGARILLLDREARPIPIDATGELYVGGPGLARGYLRRPARTAVAFVPDPFGQIPGERLYRTGDLARCWPDGAVEFLGRRDQQVKVRGVRIELGEIEATLAAHPAVRQAAVIDLPDVTGDSRRLVACLVTDPTLATATELHGLRGYLGQRLPEAMVPSAFTPVDTLPRTPSGKVDRAALARTVAEAPDTSPVDDLSPTAGAPPRDPVEELMVEIWHEILGRDTATLADAGIADATIADATIADATIGIHDDFFDLGGHSLLATRVVSRVRSAFSVELPLRQLFEAPTVAGLSAAVRQRLEGGQPAAQEPIERLERDPSGPDAPRLALSFAQERLWFLDRMEPGNSAYNVPAAIRLHGTLDVPVLAGCLAEIVRRHASLRTHFEAPAGEPRQVIESAITAPLPLIDLSALGDSARATELAQWSADEANRPFDLLRGPLFRFTLLRLQPNEHAALLTLHHIVSDAWSMETLVRECVLLYRTTLSGQPSPLSEIDVQYADFAAWQRQRLSDDFIARELRYWRRTLDGAPPLLELPTDRPRGAVQSRHGARASLRLPRGLAVELHRASRAADATLFMTLLAAFQALLHRLSGQPDICIGSPIAGRTHEELQGLIGFFVNTLVLRGSLGRDLDFRRHLDATRHACLGAYAHQELPFERLVAELHPERSLSHTPLFQVMFVFQSRLLDLPALPELHFERLHVDSGREQMGMITLQMAEDDDGLLALLDFNRDLFDPTTMARLLARFHNLLAVVARQPHLALGSIPLLSPAERHQAAYEWNDTATPGTLPGTDATPRTLLDLLAEPLARTPDAVAILAGGEHLSYGELHRRANRLANHLRHLGVGPEARVALCLERSTEAITALLAVWKAGGAYLPLDPAVPAERLAFTLEDAGATVLLSDATQAAGIPGTRARVVLLDHHAASIDRCDATPPEVPLTPRNLAYVIYTSGSTGRPKGVLVQHASVLAIVRSFLDSYELAPRDRVLQQTTLTFDVSVNEIFPVLAAGGGLVLEPPSTGIDLERRIRRVAEQRVSILSAAPSLLARLDEAAADLGSLRLVLSGGEALALGDVERLRAGATVVNGYGPTEATVCCLAYDLAEMQSDEPKIPIGRPLRETEILLLDQAGLRLAIGQAGEVCVAGAGLARGYLRRPGRTAAAFTPHPEGLGQQGVGQRIYRTGDLARYLPDGNLLFLGRRDHQVKIRGFRIELGEIEAALAAHPQAREVAVIVREDTPGNQRLVAYLTGDSAPEPVVLRTYLEARLPSYMVPSAFVHLDTLPLSTSGKVDQEALPVPDTSAEEIVGPRDDTERALLRIWEDLLGISPISVKADFFDLGGHSLLVVRLTARIKKELDRSVPVAAIFQEPTIERLAALLRHEIAFDWAPLVTLQSAGSKPPLFCVHPIGGEVIAYHRLAEHLGEEQPFYALQAPFAVATAERDLPIEEVAAFYLEKIRPVQATGPYFLGGYSYGCVITFEMAQQLRRAGEEVALVALIDGIFPGRSIGRRILELPQLNWRRAKAAAEYRPRPYPGRLTYFRAERGERQSAWARFHNLRRWKRLSGEPMEVQPISGNHAQCIREPWVATLAERLEATIDRITLRPLSTAAGGRRSREP